MNGWFQWRSENWPPSDYIYPLLISMHISPLKANDLLTKKGIEFLKKYAPVGCRDYYTKTLLESVGVPAYFSACMTLTLGKKYKVRDNEREGIYFVDPYFEIPSIYLEEDNQCINGELMEKIFSYYLQHKDIIDDLAQRQFFKVYSATGFLDRDDSLWRSIYKATLFYKTYSTKFDDEVLLNAEYITHWMNVDMSGKITNDDLLDVAENLVKKYASARLVVTSRIHAGLPCLGMDTPVVFIANEEITAENGTFNTPGRLNGLIELFRVMNLQKDKFFTEDASLSKIDKFKYSTTFQNKVEWKSFAQKLDQTVTEFMND